MPFAVRYKAKRALHNSIQERQNDIHDALVQAKSEVRVYQQKKDSGINIELGRELFGDISRIARTRAAHKNSEEYREILDKRLEANELLLDDAIKHRDLLQGFLDRNDEVRRVSQHQHQCFLIPKNITDIELRNLIDVIEIRREQTTDPGEKVFLDTIHQLASDALIDLGGGAELQDIEIPLLMREDSYLSSLLTQLNKDKPDVPEEELKTMADNITAIKNRTAGDRTIPDNEKNMIYKLCSSLENDLAHYRYTKDKQFFEARIEYHIDNIIYEAERTPITNGWRGIINDIRAVFNKKPAYTVSESPHMDEVRDLKAQLVQAKNTRTESDSAPTATPLEESVDNPDPTSMDSP